MAAKPRVTVRLAPETLHALAFIAARDGLPPAELARMLLSAQVGAVLGARALQEPCKEHWRAWLAEQAGGGGRPESPTQDDYDELARGALLATPAPPADSLHTPLSVTIAESDAFIKRVAGRLASRTSRA